MPSKDEPWGKGKTVEESMSSSFFSFFICKYFYSSFLFHSVASGGPERTVTGGYGRYPTCRLCVLPTSSTSRSESMKTQIYIYRIREPFILICIYTNFIFLFKQGTFRALLASRVQNLDTIVRSSDRDHPVVNLRVLTYKF